MTRLSTHPLPYPHSAAGLAAARRQLQHMRATHSAFAAQPHPTPIWQTWVETAGRDATRQAAIVRTLAATSAPVETAASRPEAGASDTTARWDLMDDRGRLTRTYTGAAEAVEALNELPPPAGSQLGTARVVAFDTARSVRLPGAIHRHAPVGGDA